MDFLNFLADYYVVFFILAFIFLILTIVFLVLKKNKIQTIDPNDIVVEETIIVKIKRILKIHK